jgi:hypothetical protein
LPKFYSSIFVKTMTPTFEGIGGFCMCHAAVINKGLNVQVSVL